MSMSTCVIGFRPPDKKWKEMKAIWDSCEEANIEPPEVVDEFFGYGKPDPRGLEVELSITAWSDESSEGYELEVADIPKSLTHIRFFNSW